MVVTPLKVIEKCYTISTKSSQDWNILKFEKIVEQVYLNLSGKQKVLFKDKNPQTSLRIQLWYEIIF